MMSTLPALTIYLLLLVQLGVQAQTGQRSLKTTDSDNQSLVLNSEITPIPRPNSGQYSYEEANAHKHDIFNMQLSPKQPLWKNPTTGGAIHITKNDEIEVYQFTFGFSHLSNHVVEQNDSLIFIVPTLKDTSIIVQQDQIKTHVGGIGCGNPASVLITSEYDLTKSKSIHVILAEIYEPGTQIYYLKNKSE